MSFLSAVLKRLFPWRVRRNSIQVLGFQGDEYTTNYRLGASGKMLPEGTGELVALVVQANRWFGTPEHHKAKEGPAPWPEYYPQYPQIRKLGEEIYRQGGHWAMVRAAAFVRARGNSTKLLENMWNGIGRWIA